MTGPSEPTPPPIAPRPSGDDSPLRRFARSSPQALPSELLTDFVPTCPDCKYDLVGLADGRCPECGLRFTDAGLRRLWVARKRSRQENLSAVRSGLGILPVFLSCLFPLGTMWGFAAAVGLWTAVAGYFAWRNREWLLANSHFLLVFLAPLFLMMIVVAATSFGRSACAILGVLACGVCWLALRRSPLISACAILLLVCGPLVLIAGVMYLQANAVMAKGHYWSDFDQPTPHGWQALPCAQSISIARWIALVPMAIAGVVLLYARRALVRLRARGTSKTAPA